MFKKYFLGIFLLASFSTLHCDQGIKSSSRTAKKNKVMCITIPKTGTHLLKKCLTLMGVKGLGFDYRKSYSVGNGFNLLDGPKKKDINLIKNGTDHVVHKHMYYSSQAEKLLNEHTYANFLTIRDPRAQMVSLAFAAKAHRIGGNDRPIEEILIDFIQARKENFLPHVKHRRFGKVTEQEGLFMIDYAWTLGSYEFYKLYLPWMKAKNFYTVKFEDLVGPAGGGSVERQYQEIINIANHMGISLSNERIAYVAQNLFGGTSTFREGQAEGWKKSFTPRVKEAFKQHTGLMQLLIDLGYEQDFNW